MFEKEYMCGGKTLRRKLTHPGKGCCNFRKLAPTIDRVNASALLLPSNRLHNRVINLSTPHPFSFERRTMAKRKNSKQYSEDEVSQASSTEEYEEKPKKRAASHKVRRPS